MARRPLLLLLVAAVLALGAMRAAPAWARTTVGDVAQGLTCQCGCGLTVANCNHPNCEFSVPVKAQIGKMLDKGMTRVEIIAFFRHKYGEKILSSPTTHGFNLLAWTMPFIALALGGLLMFFVLGRWRRATPSLPGESEPPTGRVQPAADSRLREKLAQQVREQL